MHPLAPGQGTHTKACVLSSCTGCRAELVLAALERKSGLSSEEPDSYLRQQVWRHRIAFTGVAAAQRVSAEACMPGRRTEQHQTKHGSVQVHYASDEAGQEQLVDDDSRGVMMAWEGPLMQATPHTCKLRKLGWPLTGRPSAGACRSRVPARL